MTIRQCAVFAWPEVAGQAAFASGVVTIRGRGRALQLHTHGLAHRVIGHAQVTRHLHMRDVERFAELVVAVRLAVLRQAIFNLHPRHVQEVAQRVFVFIPVEPALHGAAVLRDKRLLGAGQRRGQGRDERVQFRRFRTRSLLRRHLTSLHPVVNAHPSRKIGLIGGQVFQVHQVQPGLARFVIVAVGAVIEDERAQGFGRRSGVTGQSRCQTGGYQQR